MALKRLIVKDNLVSVKLFIPSDFSGLFSLTEIDAAQIANAKLATLIQSWPVVYGIENTQDNCPDNNKYFFQSSKCRMDNYRARLAFIEPIDKEPCKHTVAMSRFANQPWTIATSDGDKFLCGKCGVELVIEWKEKK